MEGNRHFSLKHFRSSCESPMKMLDRNGIILSPKFPRKYQNDAKCVWYISAEPDEFIKLTINSFNLEPGKKVKDNNGLSITQCPFDYLFIYESDEISTSHLFSRIRHQKNSNVWGVYCGNHSQKIAYTKNFGSTLYLYMKTDSSRRYKGFNISYDVMKRQSIQDDFRYVFLPPETVRVNSEIDVTKPATASSVSARGALQTIAFGFTIMLFVCIAFVVIMKVVQLYTKTNLVERARWSSDSASGSVEVHLPSPPPQYSDVVKTDAEWQDAMRRIRGDANNISELESQRQAAQVEVAYNLENSEQQIRTESNTLGSANIEPANPVSSNNEPQQDVTINPQERVNNYSTIQIDQNNESSKN